MKPSFAPKLKSRPAKLVIQAVVATLLTTAVVLYNLWFWVIAPQQQQAFTQTVAENAEYARAISEGYLKQLQQPLVDMATDFPVELLIGEENPTLWEPNDLSYQAKADAWLAAYQSEHQRDFPTLKTLVLLPIDKVNRFLTLSPQDALERDVSFIFIDMVNRLQKGKTLFVEAAKIPNTKGWELHQVAPIRDANGAPLAILHATFTLKGLRAIFSPSDLSLGQFSFIQSIENERELHFLRLGTVASNKTGGFSKKTKTIANSHWRVVYEPSMALMESVQQIPWWFFASAVSIPLFFILLTIYSLARLRTIEQAKLDKEKTSKDKRLQKNRERKQALSNAIPSKNQAPDGNQQQDKSAQEKTDIPDEIFRAYDIRGLAHQQLSCDLVTAIGQAIASEVLAAGDKSMVVGYDARSHSQEFADCMMAGIMSTGCDVINIGLVPTPLLNFSACQHKVTSSGVIITASHNPKEYNGCKMVVKGQTLVEGDIQRLKQRIIDGDVVSASDKGQLSQEDFSQAYIEHISSDLAIIDGWRVVIDAANGAASQLAPRLFEALQCSVTPLFCEFDGDFPNHDPDPSVAENLASLIQTVKEQKADIGFAFDGDGDRVMVVTASGKILWPDQLMMLFAQDIVSRNPGCDVVFDIKSSHLLSEAIAEHGGRPIMWKTGHSHIKAKMRETGALLGGEFSGHIFFKERWFGFDDGLYAGARLLELMTLTGESIDQLFEKLPVMVSTAEIKVAIDEDKKFSVIKALVKQAKFPGGQVTTIDGLRVDFDTGWGLVRASNTAAALTLRFQAASQSDLETIQQQFKRALHQIDKTLVLEF